MSMAELTSQVTFRVKDEVYDLIEVIAKHERRKPNEVARALLERGAAAYSRDGQLFEPQDTVSQIARVPVVPKGERNAGLSKSADSGTGGRRARS